MSDDTQEQSPVMLDRDYAGSLNDLVEELVRVELVATPVAEGSAVDAGFREQLQARAAAALRHEAAEPDLQSLLTSALVLWAERE